MSLVLSLMIPEKPQQARRDQGFSFSELALGSLKRESSNEALLSNMSSSVEDEQPTRFKNGSRLSTTMHSSHRLFNVNYLKVEILVFLVGQVMKRV